MYKCVRCEIEYQNKTDMERHLNIKNKCKSKYKNFILTNDDVIKLSILKDYQKDYFIYKKILDKDELICNYCFNVYSDKKTLNRHNGICNMRSLFDYYHKIGNIYYDIINNNVNLIKINEIISCDQDYSDNHLSIEQKSFILLNLDPYKILEYILLDKKNLNILPINNSMSCIILNNQVRKINNKFLLEVLFFKLKRFVKKIKKDFDEKNIINNNINKNYDIDSVFTENINYLVFFIIKNIQKKNINNINYFINDNNVVINNYKDIIEYFENIEIEYIYELCSFEDEPHYDYKGDRMKYSKNGLCYMLDVWDK